MCAIDYTINRIVKPTKKYTYGYIKVIVIEHKIDATFAKEPLAIICKGLSFRTCVRNSDPEINSLLRT